MSRSKKILNNRVIEMDFLGQLGSKRRLKVDFEHRLTTLHQNLILQGGKAHHKPNQILTRSHGPNRWFACTLQYLFSFIVCDAQMDWKPH